MEPATLAAIAAFVGPVIALVGVLGSQIIANRREEQRRNHERDLKRLELEEKRTESLRAERIEAYKELNESTSLIDPHMDEWEGLADPFSKIQLLSDSQELIEAAERLKDAAFYARQSAKQLFKEGKETGKQSVQTDQQFLTVQKDARLQGQICPTRQKRSKPETG